LTMQQMMAKQFMWTLFTMGAADQHRSVRMQAHITIV